ncbi:MAG: hypothetical protein KDF58_10090 [Alphaproteobacteria bacterium]|nr:hypothetical protein [Alphaproteobacteria bacterium]
MKSFILNFYVISTIIVFSLITSPLYAQEDSVEPTSTIVLDNNISSEDKVNEVSILSLVGFIVVAISVPFVISFIIQILTENTLTAYICTYCLVVLLYYLVSLIFTDMSGSRNIMTYVFLLLPSMFGSLFAQFAYYMMLVKEGKNNKA